MSLGVVAHAKRVRAETSDGTRSRRSVVFEYRFAFAGARHKMTGKIFVNYRRVQQGRPYWSPLRSARRAPVLRHRQYCSSSRSRVCLAPLNAILYSPSSTEVGRTLATRFEDPDDFVRIESGPLRLIRENGDSGASCRGCTQWSMHLQACLAGTPGKATRVDGIARKIPLLGKRSRQALCIRRNRAKLVKR
jgi:hypothetical protein